MARRNLNARQPAKNIGASPPTRKHMGPDGVPLVEKLNPIPFSRKVVSPDGDVVMLSLANGFTIRGFKGNDYGVQKWEEKLAAGFLPYDECPVATGRIPGDSPCKGKFSNDECCPHMEKVMEARRAVHRKEQQERDRKSATNQDRMLSLLEKQAHLNIAPEGTKRGGPGRGRDAD